MKQKTSVEKEKIIKVLNYISISLEQIKRRGISYLLWK